MPLLAYLKSSLCLCRHASLLSRCNGIPSIWAMAASPLRLRFLTKLRGLHPRLAFTSLLCVFSNRLRRELAGELGNDCSAIRSAYCSIQGVMSPWVKLTVKGDNAENENKGKNKDNNGIDLETGRLVGVESCGYPNVSNHFFGHQLNFFSSNSPVPTTSPTSTTPSLRY